MFLKFWRVWDLRNSFDPNVYLSHVSALLGGSAGSCGSVCFWLLLPQRDDVPVTCDIESMSTAHLVPLHVSWAELSVGVPTSAGFVDKVALLVELG